MMMLDKIRKALEVFYNIPSIIVLLFVLIYDCYRYYKKHGQINDIMQDSYYVYDVVEEFKPIGKHINIAFWILATYLIYF